VVWNQPIITPPICQHVSELATRGATTAEKLMGTKVWVPKLFGCSFQN